MPVVVMDGESTLKTGKEEPSKPESSPTQRPFPWFIISLVIVNWTVFLYSLYKNNCPKKFKHDKCLLKNALGRFSFQPLRQNPQLGPAGSTLMDLGGFKWNFKEKTKKWNILSSIFFHKGLVSVILDTISLLFMGVELEQNFGIVKVGSLYLLSSIGGSLWASLKFKGSAYVGGSSGVCGLTGGAIAEFFMNLNMHEEKLKRFLSLCVGVAINFTTKLIPRADVFGNIGGLYMGFLLGFMLLIRRQPESKGQEHKSSGFDPQQPKYNYSRYQQVLWVIALISTIIQFLDSLIEYISY